MLHSLPAGRQALRIPPPFWRDPAVIYEITERGAMTEWETSTFRGMLEKRFFFVVFQRNKKRELVLQRVMDTIGVLHPKKRLAPLF